MSRKLTAEEFVSRAQKLHHNNYDYSAVEYVNSRTKVEIVCPTHSSFWQTPHNHLQGIGCPACAGVVVPTTAEFISKARSVHGDKYDYSHVSYVNNRTKVEIVCPTHSSFWQTPHDHLRGYGCPACGSRALCENIVGEILHKHYPDVQRQYPIKGEEFNMRGDFYIPSIDTLVEFNGAQHYKPIEAWGGEEAFERQQLRDADLRATCAETLMKLCIIDGRPYSPVKNPPTEDVILAAIQAIQEAQQ